jgi:uncharacterized membrane protein YphA (DoxX/SURF4 family)
MNKTTKIIRIILQVILSLAFLAAGFAKLTGSTDEVAMFSALHLDSTLIAIGVLEIIIPIMLWFKKTRSAAILLISATLGAAIAETISLSMGTLSGAIVPAVILVISWIVFAIDQHGCNCSCEICKDCVAKAK